MKSYLRFLSRNKFYTFVQFIGLSISLAFVLIITCYVWQNLNVCRYYPDTDNVYCVASNYGSGGVSSGYLWGETFKDNIPEIQDACLVVNGYAEFTMDDGSAIEPNSALRVDDNFWEFFPTEFVYGSPEIFNDDSNVAVTEEFANLHGGVDIIGRTLTNGKKEYTISAIVRGMENSIFVVEGPVIMSTSGINTEQFRENPLSIATGGTLTFLKVRDNVGIDELLEKLDYLYTKMNPDVKLYDGRKHHFSLCPFNELFFSDLNDDEDYDGLKKGKKGLIISFSIIVLFLLISAVFNYINLNTALAGKRSREMATRMILGDGKRVIIIRSMLESVAFVAVCLGAAFLIAILSIDGINALLNSPVPLAFSLSQEFIYIYIAIFLLTSALCGVVPAFISFNFKPVEIIKGEYRFKSKRVFSKVFIIVQYSLSCVMIALAIVVNIQIHHMIDMPLNSNIDNLYYISFSGSIDKLQADLLSQPYVKRVGQSEGTPGRRNMQIGMPINDQETITMGMIRCDSAAFSMYDFEILFKNNNSSNTGLWLTESSFEALGMDYSNPVLPQALLKGLWWDADFEGVIGDVPLSPALSYDPKSLAAIVVRKPYSESSLIVETIERTPEIEKQLFELADIESKRQSNNLYIVADYVEDLLMEPYEQVRKQSTLVSIFMIITILLSVLGQLAMSTYYASESKMDIGIRKVFGGSVEGEILRSLKGYLVRCVVAIVIAIPVAVYLSGIYLDGFTYKMNLSPWIFIVSAAGTLLISIASVIVQLVKAARTNPAEALKKE